ncbi:AraC family transcriptional regulator [Pseudomonas cannabina]|uniref:AraC family transcriptional regulator n=3 Tax=Pseudomonas syringae group TaxID=136849 RepID=A0A3M3PYZ4_PSECA|nr:MULTISPECIES: AraC family transcriptional regulator [Pseudomonas syringae group]KPB73984.1 AraC family transcriptional regulator [Pseudomonas syringae pv. maculicola]KPW16158.1 AraC family transcriptional regulator [Pseudomonas cannabina pv. alisalensis]MBM0137760.1 AraC family transcriptional regulator [Pseudomonas cannabina pv. alisalensis]QHE95374.1 helix-turn-helix domain-containing protein [Pseudomonas syringae pv. maculicola str. ES4326]QQN22342.1 AraC family transcriptional regulator
MPEPSSLASWTRALRKQLDALGADSNALCLSAGIDPRQLDDPDAQFPAATTALLWELAVQTSLDPTLGLRVSRFVSPTTFHALGYTLVASGSLREVFERIVRYHSVADDSLELDFRAAGERYEFRFSAPKSCPSPIHELLDAFAAIYLRTCRNRLGRGYAPLAVHLQRPAPDNPQPWHDLFRSALNFSAKENMLEFGADDFDGHLHDGPIQLTEHNTNGDPLPSLIWEQRVRSAIETLLPDGEPTAQSIAEALHLSERSLERHLADEGCCYDLLLNQCRQNLALLHMSEPQTSLSEVAYLLGFGDTDSLSRAFKRWTGLTPEQYRNGLVR